HAVLTSGDVKCGTLWLGERKRLRQQIKRLPAGGASIATLQGADSLSAQMGALGQFLLAQPSSQAIAPQHLSKSQQRRRAHDNLPFLGAEKKQPDTLGAAFLQAILAGWRVPAKGLCAGLCAGLCTLFLVLTPLFRHTLLRALLVLKNHQQPRFGDEEAFL